MQKIYETATYVVRKYCQDKEIMLSTLYPHYDYYLYIIVTLPLH